MSHLFAWHLKQPVLLLPDLESCFRNFDGASRSLRFLVLLYAGIMDRDGKILLSVDEAFKSGACLFNTLAISGNLGLKSSTSGIIFLSTLAVDGLSNSDLSFSNASLNLLSIRRRG